MHYTAHQIAELTGAKIVGNPNIFIDNFSFDSRNIYTTENTAFIAFKTSRNSGENYISDAIEKGIKIIIAEKPTPEDDHITWLITGNTLEFIQKLAKVHLAKLNSIKTIGITGSNGKTIIKEWLYQCLSSDYQIVKSPKSFNSQIGLPLSILQANKNDEIGIFEAGISKPGEMELLENVLKPQIGILTHIGDAHSAHFLNDEELISEKLKLFQDSETIIYNGDNQIVNEKISELYKDKRTISFGLKSENQYTLYKTDHPKILRFNLNGDLIEIPVEKQDDATLSNALCVSAVLHTLGFEKEKIAEKLNQLQSVEMRLESVSGINNNLIINDSYNLDFDSLKIAFQNIKEYNYDNKILILTDFQEVRNKENLYSQVTKLVNEQNLAEIVLIGEDLKKYKNQFQAKVSSFETSEDLIESEKLSKIHNSLILIKGARKFATEKIKDELQLQKHDTILEVNLNALLHNINVHKSYLKPTTKMMAMVKAFAYGTGGYEVAEFLQHHHIDYLGVAYADEGAELRKRGITLPIMVMNPEQHSYDSVIDYHLEPEIYSFRVLELFCNRLKSKGISEKFPVHIKIETGMNRLGFREPEIDELIEVLKQKNVVVKSIFSHLSTADMPDEEAFALQQLETFNRISSKLIANLPYKPIRHILNSPGITTFTDYQYDMVRIGIGMYGISYDENVSKKLQNVVKFKTLISQISELNEGESVGYGRAFKPEKPTRIATVPVGYADGIRRLAGNGVGRVGINNKLAPIVGRVCMDMMMVDVTDIQANEGDEVIIFNGKPSIHDFAEYCQTFPYEVLTSISHRVKRIYIKD